MKNIKIISGLSIHSKDFDVFLLVSVYTYISIKIYVN